MSLIIKSTTQLRSVAALVERQTGVRASQELITRWTTIGCGGVLLSAVLVGGEWETTEAAFAAFVQAASIEADNDLANDPGVLSMALARVGWPMEMPPAFC